MAESSQRRNERAQRQLRELGLDPGPLKGAANRLRKARGAAKGYSASRAVGKPKVGESLISRPSEVRQARPRLRTVGGQPKRDVSFGPAGRVVQSTDRRYVRQQLKAASRRGERVSVRITASGPSGQVRTHAINGTAEQQRAIRDRTTATQISTGGGTAPPASDGVDIVSKPQLVFSSSPEVFDRGSGFDPDDLLDYLDSYDDDFDAWADLWDGEYGEL